MRAPLESLCETHLIGRRCREHMLDAEHVPALRLAPFIWVGISELRPPYRMVRRASVHSHLVACVSGCGRAMIDGKVVRWQPGHVLLGPVGRPHAFEVEGAGPWTIAWVFFDDVATAPVLQGAKAELIEADATDFVAALRLLTREAAGAADPAILGALVTVVDSWARRIAGPGRVDGRLWRLWARVETDLGRAWTVADMAREACVSEEHVRRLCQRHFQRSPMEHLTELRMRRASTMLRSTAEKVDVIAQLVGYGSLYSFSAAFKRWSGRAPTGFRGGCGRM